MSHNGSGIHKRGFASMPREEVVRIAASGGKAAQEQGRAHRFTSAEASIAGKKGAEVRKAKKLAELVK